MPFTLIAALIIAFLIIAFSLQNNTSIAIQFFRWNFEGSLGLILLTTLFLGILIHLLVSTPASIRKSRQLAQLKKRISDLEQSSPARFHPDID